MPLPTSSVTFLLAELVSETDADHSYHAFATPSATEVATRFQEVIGQRSGKVLGCASTSCDAVFASPRAALDAALAFWQAMALEHQGNTNASLLRIILHVGPTGIIGERYFGATLNRARQLLAATPAGCIILSQVAHDTLADQLPAGITLHDHSTGRLKDLLPPEHFFQLLAPDMLSTIVPPRVIETYPTNLPTQPTPFLGRTRERHIVQELLQEPGKRLITLIAPSGTGKTRFALDVAANRLDFFSHGVFFVSLAPINDPSLVIPTIAHILGLKEVPTLSTLDQLQAYARDRRLLLVLDNIEQVIDAAPEIDALLGGTHHLKILVTSHIPLQISGEHVIRVPPLEVPDLAITSQVDQLVDYTSIALFVERLQQVNPHFMFDETNASTIAQLCACVGGIPLAIELVATYGNKRTLPALLIQLQSRQMSASLGAQRPLTLQQVLDWSYEQLERNAQILFARLGVFSGGCTIEGAESVCCLSEEEAIDVLSGLNQLLQRNLLLVEELDSGVPRYTMIDCIHEDAQARLVARGELSTMQQRHAEHFCKLAKTLKDSLRGPNQGAWLQRLDSEHHNLRAALRWAIEHNDGATALQICNTIWTFWYLRGYRQEGCRWAESALAISQTVDAQTRAQAHQGIAVLYSSSGNSKLGQAHSQQALALFRELGDTYNIAIELNNLGVHSKIEGHLEEAKTFYEESLKEQRALPQKASLLALTLTNLGHLAMGDNDPQTARSYLEEALTEAQEIGDRRVIVNTLANLGVFTLLYDEIEAATRLFRTGLHICRELGGHDKLATILDGMAGIASALGHHHTAARLLGAAEAYREVTDQPYPVILEFDRYDQLVARVRAQIDPSAFTDAWTEGRTLSFDQAIALALEITG